MDNILLGKAKSKINKAVKLIKANNERISIGIRSVDEVNKRVYYINAEGLEELQKAHENKMLEENILENPKFKGSISFDQIKDVI